MYKIIDELLEGSKQGDKLSKEELLLKLRPLIISSINKYYPNSKDFEDLIQDGNIVILECILNFDISKGVYFLGYVKTMLKYNYLQNHRIKHMISLNTPLGEDSELEMIDLLKSDDLQPLDVLILNEFNENVKNSLSVLAPRQLEIIILFYINKLSIGEIAESLNISYRTVVNTKTKAIEKLKNELLNKGL